MSLMPRLRFLLLFLAATLWPAMVSGADSGAAKPLRVALAGLAHGHVGGFLRQMEPEIIELVGVWEESDPIWEKYQANPRLAGVPRHRRLEDALAGSIDAVWAFSDTISHLRIVEAAAPRRLSVIVEKPLAMTWGEAAAMAALARRHGTLVLTNYETSWYPAFAEVRQMIRDNALGPLRQIYVQAGHEGPVKIRVGPEFLEWLRDPRRGGGALFDFGCYGANLATWWMDNQPPVSVSAHTSQFDVLNYPRCDDHAVIQMIYPERQVTVIGSWHWPYSRKDAALYGETGAVVTADASNYTLRTGRKPLEARKATIAPRDPLRWFAGVVRAGHDPVDDPSSLANNLVVMQILEAARRSAQENRVVTLAELGNGNVQ